MDKRTTFVSLMAFCLAALMLGCISCKKNQDETKLYLSGTMKITSYPLYTGMGTEAVVHLSGVSHPDGKALGLYVKLPWKAKYDTLYFANKNPLPSPMDVDVPIIFPDSLASFTVNFFVYPIDPEKYYTSNGSFFTTTVDDALSIPEIYVDRTSPLTVIDDRDQMAYNFVLIGENYWISRNICTPVDMEGEGGHRIGCPYYRSEAINRAFGRFYTWEEAMTACPIGWHLPSCEECESLPSDVGELMVDAHFNGDKMWAFWPAISISETSGLNLIPVGYCNSSSEEQFDGILEYSCFWTSDKRKDNPSQAIYKYIFLKENELKTGYAKTNSLAMPVRCVADTIL